MEKKFNSNLNAPYEGCWEAYNHKFFKFLLRFPFNHNSHKKFNNKKLLCRLEEINFLYLTQKGIVRNSRILCFMLVEDYFASLLNSIQSNSFNFINGFRYFY